jgi:hypothetical protein
MRSRTNHLLTASVLLACVFGVPLGNRFCESAPAIEDDFGRDETVETISITIATGDDGQDVDETMAIDLGLGFPLWLDPLGREADEATPFGAVPDQSDAGPTVAAGQSATFTFRAEATDGGDRLHRTPALLNEVRVSDISRIGLLATGNTDWCLHRLQVVINGKTLYSADEMDVHIQNEQALAQLRLDEVGEEVARMRADAESLAELVSSGLATEEEEQRLRDIDEVIVPQLQEQSRIERQLAGSYPWYLARDFQSPWRNGHNVESMSVTLTTATHAGADTTNYVYYQTGGRKYLLTSPLNPLTADFGPQTFDIDLIGGPATAGDLRGHCVGMLGHGEPYGDAPDRCHVQRMLVEVDGRVVYDSEENELDRLSLEATRLIPPAHLDDGGEVVVDTPVARETYVWRAGTGIGVDLVRGGAEALPPPTDPAWPPPEPGLEYDETVATDFMEDGFQEGFGPFPGETYIETDVAIGDPWGGDPWGGDPWGGDPWGGDPWGGDPWGGDPWGGDSWGWEPAASWLDVLAGLLLDRAGVDLTEIVEAIEEAVADPIGEPVQIENIVLDISEIEPSDMHVAWEVSGDASDVESYLAEIFVLRPHEPEPNLVLLTDASVPPGDHLAEFTIDPARLDVAITPDPNSTFFIARVTPVMAADSSADPGQFGAAVPALESMHSIQMNRPNYVFQTGGAWDSAPIEFGPPLISSRALWTAPAIATHSGFVFASTFRTPNAVFQPGPDDDVFQYLFDDPDYLNGARQVVLHLGFVGDLTDTSNSATVDVAASVLSEGWAFVETSTASVALESGTWDDPQQMHFVSLDLPQLIDPATLDGVPALLRVLVRISDGIAEPDRPPVVVGLRQFITP